MRLWEFSGGRAIRLRLRTWFDSWRRHHNSEDATSLASIFEFDPEFVRRLLETLRLSPASFRSAISREDEMFLHQLEGYRGNRERACVAYMSVGKQMMDEVRQLAHWAFGGWEACESVLDFASGYGRFARHLVQEVSPQRVWTSDVYADALRFNREQLGVGGFASTTDPDAFECPRRFDLVFVSSLFSHLPSHRFVAWLAKLYSLLSDRGLLVFTTQGIDLADDPAGDFVFQPISESRSLDVQEYGLTFVSQAFVAGAIRAAIGDGAAWRGFPHGYLGFQDLYVVSRDPGRRFESLRYDPGLAGHVDDCRRVGDQIGLAGWAADLGASSPPRVQVFSGARCLAECVPTVERPDIAKQLGSDAFSRAGWWCRIAAGAVGSDDWITIRIARGAELERVLSLGKLKAMLRR